MTRKITTKRVPMTAIEIDTLTDEVKDEIDRLHDIKDTKIRVGIAKELIEYIQMHHVDYL